MATSLTVKPLHPRDLARFALWVQRDIEADLAPAHTLASLSATQRRQPESLWGAYRKATLQAGALLHWEQPSVRLDLLVVAKAYRRQGLGQQFMHALMANARTQHCQDIQIMVRAHNQAALAFYASLGASRLRLHPNYYPDVDDGIALELAL
jgi:ribosomal protein S18 acetylase RimI-like enzyme